VDLDYGVFVIDNFSTGKIENLRGCKSKIKLVKMDINDDSQLKKYFAHEKNISYIFHLAALPRIERSIERIRETHRANVDGIFTILELARYLKIKKFIFTSSSSVYGAQKKNPLREDLVPNPQNPYATQKLIGEKYCDIYSNIFGIPIMTLRLFNVYGSRMRGEGVYQLVFIRWLEQIKKGLPLTIYGDGKQTRDFTYIDDVVDALIRAMHVQQKNQHEIINIGSGRQIPINYLASLFHHPTKYLPPRKFEERFKQADIRKARRLLSWSPQVSIEEGVKKLLKDK
jgi:UDP-glucose 4-epimerase